MSSLQCPTCGKCRPRRCWKPSQWTSSLPVIHHYFQCKVCDAEISEWPGYGWIHNASDTPVRSTPMFTVRPRPLPMPQFYGHENIPAEASQLQDLITNMDTKVFSHLVQAWMDMPRSTRKNLSYNGAVCSRQGDPVHYHCPETGQNYFDPGNRIYTNALRLLAPELTDLPWNAETRGDICESIMGFAFILERRSSTTTTAAVLTVSKIIDMVSWPTFRLHQNVGDGRFLNWINWI